MIINTIGGGSGGGAVAVIDVDVTLSAGTGDVSGISISATAPGQATLSGTTDSSGKVQLTNAVAGATYTVTGSKTDYTVSTGTVKIEHLSNSVSLTTMKSATVTVTVTDAQSGSVSGLTVVGSGAASVSAVTNSSGKATFSLSVAGAYSFTLASGSIPTGGSASTYTVTVEPGGVYSDGVVAITYGYGFAAVQIAINTAGTESRCEYPQTIMVNGSPVSNSAYGLAPAFNANGANSLGTTGMTGFDMGGWATHKILEGIKPVLKNGTTWSDLGKTSMATWDTSEGDAFTEFPINWLAIKNDGTNITIIFSDKDERPDSDFQLYAFAKGCDSYSNDQIVSACASASLSAIKASDSNDYFANCFHIGCFKANGSTDGIYSRRGSAETQLAYAAYWQGANRRGNDYDCVSFQQWTYLQCLFVLLYKSTNSQTMHSNGISSGSRDTSNSGLSTTAFGMAGSVANKTTANAFFWIRDPWGDAYRYIGGLWNRAGSSSKAYYWLPRQANSRAFNNGWSAASSAATQASLGTDTGLTGSDSGGYIKTVAGTNLGGFCPTSQSGGSATTYWPDYGSVDYNSSDALFPNVGGYYSDDDDCGIFYCRVNDYSTFSYSYYVACLSYRGGHW